jgi:hypothetical protein
LPSRALIERDCAGVEAEFDDENVDRRGVDGGPVVVRGERKGDLNCAEAFADDLNRVLGCMDFGRGDAECNEGAERGSICDLVAFEGGVKNISSFSSLLCDVAAGLYCDRTVADVGVFILFINGERNGVISFLCCFF